MSRFASKTIRRLPGTTREIARISNDLASAQVRLANRIQKLVEIERTADAFPTGEMYQRGSPQPGECLAGLCEVLRPGDLR